MISRAPPATGAQRWLFAAEEAGIQVRHQPSKGMAVIARMWPSYALGDCLLVGGGIASRGKGCARDRLQPKGVLALNAEWLAPSVGRG